MTDEDYVRAAKLRARMGEISSEIHIWNVLSGSNIFYQIMNDSHKKLFGGLTETLFADLQKQAIAVLEQERLALEREFDAL